MLGKFRNATTIRIMCINDVALTQLRRLVDQHQDNVYDYTPVLGAPLMFDGLLRQIEDVRATGSERCQSRLAGVN